MLVESLNLREFEAGVPPAKLTRKKPNSKEEETPQPPPPPTFSEAELAEAKRDAYQKGFLEGSKDGHAQAQSEHADIERTLTEILEKFTASVTPIFMDYSKSIHQLRADMPKLALSIAKKVAGEALSQDAQAVIEGAAVQCVEAMLHEPQIIVTVHETLSKNLEKKLRQLATRMQSAAHIIVQADSNIPLSDYRVDWKNGAMERTTERLWQQIDRAIGNMLQTIARETDEQMDLLSISITQATQDTSQPIERE